MKIIVLLLTLLAGMASCSKEQEVSEKISFDQIFDPIRYTELDTLTIGQLVQLVGNNLDQVSKIALNNTEIPVGSNATITEKSIYFTVPRIPKEDVNKITLYTETSSVDKAIEIQFPPFKLLGMENEYAVKGDVLVLYGESMDLYLVPGKSKVLIGEQEAEVEQVSDYEAWVRIPLDAADNSIVKFVNSDMEEYICPGRYRNSFFIIENLEDKSTTRYPDFVVPNANYPAPLSPLPIEGLQYSRIVRATSGTLNMVGNYNLVIPETLLNEGEKYDLKFEMFIIEPVAYRFAVSLNQGSTNYMVGPGSVTTDPALQLTTNGRWKTFTIPLDYWKGKGGTKNLRVFVTLPVGVKYDLCMDNFRIQPK